MFINITIKKELWKMFYCCTSPPSIYRVSNWKSHNEALKDAIQSSPVVVTTDNMLLNILHISLNVTVGYLQKNIKFPNSIIFQHTVLHQPSFIYIFIQMLEFIWTIPSCYFVNWKCYNMEKSITLYDCFLVGCLLFARTLATWLSQQKLLWRCCLWQFVLEI